MPMRVSEADEELGLDASQHDEKYFQGTLLVTKQDSFIEEEIDVQFSKTNQDYKQKKILINDPDTFNGDDIEEEKPDHRNEQYLKKRLHKKHNGSFI